jgi:3D (Asp-Asp-Asp) domain-containing protein
MTRSPMFWLLLAAAGVASYPIFKVEAHNERKLQTTDTQDDQHPAKYVGRHETTRVWRISAYCCCSQCTSDDLARITVESGNRRTADRHRITESDFGRLCAAPGKYPFHTEFEIEGYGRVVCHDRGGAIKAKGEKVEGRVLRNDRLDILMRTHKEAQEFGIKYCTVTTYERE